jgi:hypothetical protein
MTDNISAELKCSDTLKQLLIKYKDNDYMTQRIYNHVVNYLPNTLDHELKNYEKRVSRNNYLTNEQNIFIQVFLSKNNYFYLPNNNLFYEYNGTNYLIIKEDNIIHNLLSSISKDRILLQWKHKTKTNIIKQIKERNLFSSIPETDTIQNVLNVLYPAFFNSKNTAKYFLTIIGDNILKKNQNIIFLVTQATKLFLNEIDNVSLLSIGNNNSIHNFMTKYHETHSYENCRLIKINENFSNNLWRELLKKIGLDLLCVAAHYSKRYENSDKFIENNSDEELENYTYYLKYTTQKNIVDNFVSEYTLSCGGFSIEWKNIHFVWKLFLSNNNLPNIIYSNVLKQMLKERYSYEESTDTFLGITSIHLPIYKNFLKFWEVTMEVNSNIDIDIYINNSIIFDNEFEVDELSSLFKYWIKEYNEQYFESHNVNITEENIVKILKHFFPNVEIIENKYVLNVTCKIWDKIKDIESSFLFIKEKIIHEYKLELISFDDSYNYYHKYCNLNSIKNIVSKHYFEKYLYYKLNDFIVYEKFIKTECFTNI